MQHAQSPRTKHQTLTGWSLWERLLLALGVLGLFGAVALSLWVLVQAWLSPAEPGFGSPSASLTGREGTYWALTHLAWAALGARLLLAGINRRRSGYSPKRWMVVASGAALMSWVLFLYPGGFPPFLLALGLGGRLAVRRAFADRRWLTVCLTIAGIPIGLYGPWVTLLPVFS